MNIDIEDEISNGNYVEINNTEVVIFRYFTMVLYVLLFFCILSFILMCVYYFRTPCEACDVFNRILVIAILIKSIAHLKITIIRIKLRHEIENDERLKNIMISLIKLFNFLTFFLSLLSLYLLHFYKNICTTNTISLKIIRIYYYFTITLYFIPLLFYISLGLFLSIIICIMINFSVDETDRIPTPEYIIKKLKIMRYEDINYIHKKRNKNGSTGVKTFIKKPSFELIIDKVKSVIIDKDNTQKNKQKKIIKSKEDKKKKKKEQKYLKEKELNAIINSNIGDENIQDMLKPLNSLPSEDNKKKNNLEKEIDHAAYENIKIYDDQNNDNNDDIIISSDKDMSNESQDDTNNYSDHDNQIYNQNDDVCSICMMNYINKDDVMIMPCDKRHFFHVNCLTKWLYKSQVCPICRTNIVNCINSKNEIV
ncbi:putative RING zinc finger protein [Plasmodium gaboni]|uniref:Putative RING zinc finger protein n=1 Tax=Plasmodium gaboni TaxID=647221 RepID=A0A151LRI3_9APIC|nr:putative RING zinc finger protein [Plasmodium gaboni]KYO01767.1 putative RING zinc finger protein [Plasmodium gaboni]